MAAGNNQLARLAVPSDGPEAPWKPSPCVWGADLGVGLDYPATELTGGLVRLRRSEARPSRKGRAGQWHT